MLGDAPTVLALAAAVCFGVQLHAVDYSMARVSGARTSAAIGAALLTLVSGAALLWGLVLLQGGPIRATSVDLLPFLFAGIADPGLTRVVSYEGIERIGPAITSAILAGSPAVAAVLAVVLLGDSLVVGTALGIACIVVGVAGLQVTYRSSSADGDRVDLLKRRLRQATPVDFLYPVTGMLLIGGAFVVADVGLRGTSDALLGTATTQTAALATLLVVTARSQSVDRSTLTADRVALVTLLATGVVISAGWFSMFLALELGSVLTVLPLVSTYPLVVVVLSYLSARERPRSLSVMAATAVIVVGAALVQIS